MFLCRIKQWPELLHFLVEYSGFIVLPLPAECGIHPVAPKKGPVTRTPAIKPNAALSTPCLAQRFKIRRKFLVKFESLHDECRHFLLTVLVQMNSIISNRMNSVQL